MIKRRKFITGSGRLLLLGGMLGTSGLLLYRRQLGDPDNCFNNPFCKSCNKFSNCDIVAELKKNNNEGKGAK